MLNRMKGFLYDCIGIMARFGKRSNPVPKVLLVKTDEIGDFMLWHHFLDELIAADRFTHHEIHFCGNSGWKSLFDCFHKGAVTHTYWLQKPVFKRDMRYRYRFLQNLYRENYSCVINLQFSRDKTFDDAIVQAAKAPLNIGMVSNLENVRTYQSGYDKGLYNELFDYPEKPLFECYRNRLFTEFITGKSSLVKNTRINTTLLPALPFTLPKPYFVVFPGSRSAARIWPAAFFITTANYLYDTFGWTAMVCGGPGDTVFSAAFLAGYQHPAVDLTAKTSLPELMSVLQNAECLLSVDTGSVHLAAAVGCTVFGVFNGSQYGRFAPYPKETADNFYAVYPDEVEKETRDPQLVKEKYEYVVKLAYSHVLPEKLIQQIKQHYHQ
ncbi:MAG TPA: glycosyltransferase family 9 protein [Sediminibacterium sp.]